MNPVPNLTADPDSDPSLSDSYLSESSESLDDEYYKQRRRTKKDINKFRSKMCFNDPIKKCAKLTTKVLTSEYKSKVIDFKLDKDPLQRWFYLLSFLSSLKIVLSQFSDTYKLLMDYPSIRVENIMII